MDSARLTVRRIASPILLVGALALAACAEGTDGTVVRIASTTSLYDTGLLDTLSAAFSAAHPGYELHIVAVGTGQALALGERKDADLLIVHAPDREEQFLADGHGLHRTTFMRNDFVVAGPGSDPAGVRSAADAPGAFGRIAAATTPFVSRGDDSGTHIRERMIWEAAGIEPAGDWYMEVGQGMGATLLVAGERQAYVLTDRATFTVLSASDLQLDELFAGGDLLANLYSLIPVSAANESVGADVFEQWMLSEAAAAIIRPFGVDKYGRALFTLIEE
jgi:tungstate transport system substrate-binding protein